MLPIILDPAKLTVGIAGEGEAFERRRAFLIDAGVEPIAVSFEAAESLGGLNVLYVAGAPQSVAAALAGRAKAAGVLVNVEDEPALCDFHVPASVRRGDLLLTVSSGGSAPGLVRLIREWLGERFGAEWGARVDEIGRRRAGWRDERLAPAERSQRTREIVAEEKWLAWPP